NSSISNNLTTCSPSSDTYTITSQKTIGFIGSYKELPPDWGAVVIKILGNKTITAKPGEVIKVQIGLTYIAGNKAPHKAVIILNSRAAGLSFIYIPGKYVDFEKLYTSRKAILFYSKTTDLVKMSNKTAKEAIFSNKPLLFHYGKIPVVVIKNNKIELIALRSNDLVWYNESRVILRANQSRIITMYIWIPDFIKPGFVFNKANTIGTLGIDTETPKVSIWPDGFREVIIVGK
ncbi:MAG: hypothetical protein J7J82_00765, partial [Staphylothermus sp.]|nr:hypothetical protein [Staphylothermus sp.]